MNRRGQDRTGALGGSGMVGLWGASSLIKSIQTGSVAIGSASASNTATITAVDMAHSALLHLGSTDNNAAANSRAALCRLSFTNSTTITGTRDLTGVADTTVKFLVLEFLPGVVRSNQSGTIAMTSVSTNTATITQVNMNKSLLINLGYVVAGNDDNLWSYVGWTNGTTVRADRYATAATLTTVGFQVVEFF
jgi:hypothetical protein